MLYSNSKNETYLLRKYLKEFNAVTSVGIKAMQPGQIEKETNLNIELLKKIKEIYYNPEKMLTEEQQRLLNLIKTVLQLLDPTSLSSLPDVEEAYENYRKKKTYINFLKLAWSASALIPVVGKFTKLGTKMGSGIKVLTAMQGIETIYKGYDKDAAIRSEIKKVKTIKNNKELGKLKKLQKDFEILDKKIHKTLKVVKQLPAEPVFAKEKIKVYAKKIKSQSSKSKKSNTRSITVKEKNIDTRELALLLKNSVKNHKESIKRYRLAKQTYNLPVSDSKMSDTFAGEQKPKRKQNLMKAKRNYYKTANILIKIIKNYIDDEKIVRKIVHQNNWKRSSVRIIKRIVKRTSHYAKNNK